MEGTGDDDGWEMVQRTGKTRARSVGAVNGQKEHVKSPGAHAANCCYTTKSKDQSSGSPVVDNAVTLLESKSPTQPVVPDEALTAKNIVCLSVMASGISGINGTAVAEAGIISSGEQSLLTSVKTNLSGKETTASRTDSYVSTNAVTNNKQPSSDDTSASHCLEQHEQQDGRDRHEYSVCETAKTDVIGSSAGAASGISFLAR